MHSSKAFKTSRFAVLIGRYISSVIKNDSQEFLKELPAIQNKHKSETAQPALQVHTFTKTERQNCASIHFQTKTEVTFAVTLLRFHENVVKMNQTLWCLKCVHNIQIHTKLEFKQWVSVTAETKPTVNKQSLGNVYLQTCEYYSTNKTTQTETHQPIRLNPVQLVTQLFITSSFLY